MEEGVASWTYVDGGPDEKSGNEDQDGDEAKEDDAEEEELEEVDVEEEEAEEMPASIQPVEESEPEPEPMDEDAPELEGEEAEPAPTAPRSRSRKAKVLKHTAPVVTAALRATRQKAKVPVEAKPKSPVMPKIKAKPALVGISKGKLTKGKGKGQSKAGDIYDMDDSE